MTINVHQLSEAVQSYLAAALGYVAQYGLMNVGAAVLLVARLIVDVPPAYIAIKNYLTKKKPKDD